MSKRNAGRQEVCNSCSDFDLCSKNICDKCGTCEGKIYHIKEEDFSLCGECLMVIQREIIRGVPPTDQGIILEETTTGNEKIIITRKRITEEEREFIFNRDGRKCVFCQSEVDLQIDHIEPFSKGGTTSRENLQTLCKTCNFKKRDRTTHGMEIPTCHGEP